MPTPFSNAHEEEPRLERSPLDSPLAEGRHRMILGRGRGQCLRDDSVRRFEFGERVLEERPLFFLPATRVPDEGIRDRTSRLRAPSGSNACSQGA